MLAMAAFLGMLAGTLLSDHLMALVTLERWHTRFKAFKQLLETDT